MKKLFLISILLFSSILLLSSCGLPLKIYNKVVADDTEDETGLRFYLQSDGTYSAAVSEDNTYKKIEIPSTYKDKPVTRIFAYGIFDGLFNDGNGVVEEIYIPEGVTEIGDYAFNGFENLKKINIPSSITYIGDNAFAWSKNLKEVHISDTAAWCNISFADLYANPLLYTANLYLNGNLITEFVVPDSITKIDSYTFCGHAALTGITVSNSVSYIEKKAFFNCTSLTSLTIGDSVSYIGEDAFHGCYKLVEVYNLSGLEIVEGDYFDNGCVGSYSLNIYTSLDTPSKQWVTDDGYIFYEDGDTCYLLGYKGEKTELTLPENCHGKNYEIYEAICYENGKVTKVTIPNSVTSIGRYAFFFCENLTSVTIGNNVTSIGNSAFYLCENLSYNDHDNAHYLGNEENPYVALLGVKNTDITSCNIHSDTKVIYSDAFEDCTKLKSVIIPEGVASIGEGTFYNCTSLKSLTISDSVTSIGSLAFSGCANLTDIIIPAGVTSIGNSAFDDCKNLERVTIKNGVTSIGEYAFDDCQSLKEVHISDIRAWCNISFSDESANPLYYADKLYVNGNLITELVIPDGVTSIPIYAFYRQKSITTVTIPDSVTSIGDDAFYGCYKLVEVYNLSDLYIAEKNFSYNGCVGYYALDVYTSLNTPSKKCITEDGYIFYEDEDACYLLGYKGDKTEITLPESHNGKNYEIYKAAFFGNDKITKVTIPANITRISSSAFAYCTSLTSVTIKNDEVTIDEDAFLGCEKLTNISIGSKSVS